LAYDFSMMMKNCVLQVADASMRGLDATFWLHFQWSLPWWFFQADDNDGLMFQQ